MKRLGATGRKWVNGTHMFFASAWVGAAISLTTLRFFSITNDVLANGDILYAINAGIKLIDDAVIIPAALGTLLTGFLISLLTPWGAFKHRWVAVKWVVTVLAILFGTFFLGPWVNELTELTDAFGAVSPAEKRFQVLIFHHTFWGGVQTVILISVVFISAIKPWGKKKQKDDTAAAK